MFIKKKKVKIIIQGSAPLQSPEGTFAGKSQGCSSGECAPPTAALSPSGDTHGQGTRALVPAPGHPLHPRRQASCPPSFC